ncbi:MAG: DUF6352 family protein [Burkholderiales bacterium]|jgi:hypothetical protein|nr:DUF6352 family protein [Burkholderiales bacterium]
MPDFWRNSGFHLLVRDADGKLVATDDFFRAYLARPEIRPVEESGPGEIALHESLMADPRRAVTEGDIAAIEDEDTRFNYGVLLDFRRRLMAAPTVEACYAAIFREGNVSVPPLFLDQLAQIIVRNILEGTDDPLEARAGELFYREQKANVADGAVMLADRETVEMHATGGAYGSLGRLIVEAQTPMKAVNLDVLDAENAHMYWLRDQRHDFVMSLNHGRAATRAFCRLVEKWIAHFTGAAVRVESLQSIADERWAWHIGLDAQSTGLLNDLWNGEDVEPGRMQRVLGLFRMEFADPQVMRPDIAGKPVYLALSMDEEGIVRMKPQNLLLNLPLASVS